MKIGYHHYYNRVLLALNFVDRSCKRVFELIEAPQRTPDPTDPLRPENVEGKVDIESNHTDNYIKFESEEGKRYIIYYGIQDTITIIEK